MIGYSKHEFGTINMLYFRPFPPKTGAILPPHLPITATFFCPPRWPWWSGSTVLFIS